MGGSNSKLKCLYLPAQSGKTRKMEDLIRHYKDISECFGDGDINLIISANNILLVKQTESRLMTDLATESEEGANDAVIKSGVFSWTSGNKECNITAESLAFRIISEKVEMVVLCAHAIRLRYLSEMIRALAECACFTKKINIWIDEADKSIKLWSKYSTLLEIPAIHQVTLISATFDSVFKKYGALQVLGYEITHPECYRCLKDSIKFEENIVTENAVTYVREVVLKHREQLLRPGVRAFIPGELRKESHNEIADFLHRELGFVVIIINCERKEILVPGEQPNDLRKYLTITNGELPPEFNITLSKLYKDSNWARFPLAITGFYCVQRGVTFQCAPSEGVHDGFMFDYGILPPITCKSEAYQTMARLFGNVGHFPNYKPVEIYTSSAMISKVEKAEKIAVYLGRMVHEQNLDLVTPKDVRAAQNFDVESEWDLYNGEFETLKEANAFMHMYGGQGKTIKSLEKDAEGFYKSSTTGKSQILQYDVVVKEMAGWSKLSNLNPKAEKATARMTICYKDLSDPDSIVFICRVAVRK
jgi:hypothetical protein